MKTLRKYKQKRHFEKTPEPEGAAASPKSKKLYFVVQKHAARNLHYDFRIEVGGVLKSWAIPKGPSINPKDKHLAVMVEDHPYEYKDFEGIIPEGNYGAGTVMIWDEGYWEPIGALASGKLDKTFDEGLARGHLVFLLKGKKLNGEFALIKLRKGGKNDWLLIKADDEFAQETNILDEALSAKTGKTMEEIRERKQNTAYIDAPQAPMPHKIKPMMAKLVEKPFDNPDWAFEIKWDGYRAITQVENGNVQIYSRNLLSFNERFPILIEQFKKVETSAIFDGEIVVLDKEGRSSFQLLQDYQESGKGNLVVFVFDLIYYDGHLLTDLPLSRRREILKSLLPETANIKFSDDIKENGIAFFEAAKKANLEGIMAKKLDSTYQIGKRSNDWQKIKLHMQQEAIICGFTKPNGSRTGFGSLLLGAYEDRKIQYIGNVGTGFNQRSLYDLMQKMKPYITDKPTFPENKTLRNITWLKPVLVCEVKFQEWTKDGSMRQPVYLGLREDKKAKEVIREKPNA